MTTTVITNTDPLSTRILDQAEKTFRSGSTYVFLALWSGVWFAAKFWLGMSDVQHELLIRYFPNVDAGTALPWIGGIATYIGTKMRPSSAVSKKTQEYLQMIADLQAQLAAAGVKGELVHPIRVVDPAAPVPAPAPAPAVAVVAVPTPVPLVSNTDAPVTEEELARYRGLLQMALPMNASDAQIHLAALELAKGVRRLDVPL